MPLTISRALIALLALAAGGIGGPPSSARAACVPPAEPIYVGIALATVDARGQWVGRWLGAHLLSCDGDAYVLDVVAASWADLERALATTGPDRFLVGDNPYIGDDTCIPSAVRRWWSQGAATGQGTVRWEVASVPPGAPAFPCPTNMPSDAPLVLRPTAP
jgi:hypothetical protein